MWHFKRKKKMITIDIKQDNTEPNKWIPTPEGCICLDCDQFESTCSGTERENMDSCNYFMEALSHEPPKSTYKYRPSSPEPPWRNTVQCPSCGSNNTWKTYNERFECRDCKRIFN
jgi:hypothetical protein